MIMKNLSQPNHTQRFLIRGLLAVGLGLLGWLWWRAPMDPEEILIPVPQVKHLHPMVSLEWDSKAVSNRLSEQPHEAHPGHALATTHCTPCHLLPSPDQLPRETWPFVITWMSNYLGYTNLYGPFQNNVDHALMPEQPMIDEAGLQAISEYYLIHASGESTRGGALQREQPGYLDQFTVKAPPMKLPPDGIITLAHWDPTRQQFYIGRGKERLLQVFNAAGEILLQKTCSSEPVGVSPLPDGFRLSLMGDFLEDKLMGRVIDVTVSAQESLESQTRVEGFHRLTQTLSEDLDGDGQPDLLLVGFGAGVEGRVSIFWGGEEESGGKETRLLDRAGALCARTTDLNQDGLTDILILTAQQQQELLLFTQEANKGFNEEVIFKQFAGYGYNAFDLLDWNQDQRVDLLVVNGNNMEIRNAPVKDYHGVRVFTQSPMGEFEESFFHPMPGAIKALARDFDQDGDLDLAAIGFYPDWSLEHPITFVYLENQGHRGMLASTMRQEHWGRWLTMDAGDFNQDGFPDLILGGAYVRHGVDERFEGTYQALPHPSLMILENVGQP